jgi:hypothetical protein
LTRNSRIENLDYLLRICESKLWNVDTPNIAGKIETLLKPFGFTRRTNRDYVFAMIDVLQSRKSGAYSSVLVQLEMYRNRKIALAHKGPKGDRNEDNNPVIYSSPVLPTQSAEIEHPSPIFFIDQSKP